MTSVIMQLPVFLPGNNRNWDQIDGVLTITEDGTINIKLDESGTARLVDAAKKDILIQCSFDYRMTTEQIEKLNRNYQTKE